MARRSLCGVLALAAVTGCAARRPQPPGPPAPPADRGLAEAVKGASAVPGFFTVWRRRERAWLELRPDQLERPFLFTIERRRGIGQNDPQLAGNTTGAYYVVVLHRLGNQVQLLAQNSEYTARAGTPEARAVRESFSDSLLAAAPVVGTPHPQRGTILVDANALLLTDIPSGTFELERAFHHPYAFDGGASSFEGVAATGEEAIFTVSAHYRLARIPVAPPGSLQPFVPPPTTLEDYRSQVSAVATA
jgi:hypothetical protein